MSRFPRLITLVRSAALAITLGSAALAAAPAMAGSSSIDFHFRHGGAGVSIGGERCCMSDRQVLTFLRWQGYHDIRFFDRRGRVVAVWAKRHHNKYRMWIDTCRVQIVDVQWIQHNRMFDEGFTGGGGNFPGRPYSRY